MRKVIRFINKISEVITMTMLVLMVIIVFWQIISRAFFGSSFSWTEELARYLMVWVSFLAVGFVYQYRAHISIEGFVNKFTESTQKYLRIFTALACILFSIILIIYGFELVQSSMTQTSPALKVPMGIVYAAIPISGILQIMNVIDITFQKRKFDI